MFRIIRDPSSGGHLHILTKVLQIHGASPYSRHGGCIGELQYENTRTFRRFYHCFSENFELLLPLWKVSLEQGTYNSETQTYVFI